jgi:hypothetical protein
MRIGFRGFDDTADIVLTPPSRVSYGLSVSTRQLVTASRAIRLRRLADRSGKTLTLSWDALPEKELALLAYLPPDEVHVLRTESGRDLEVVFGEPTRSATKYLTWDGQMTYAVDLPVFQVNAFTVSEVTPVSPPSQRLLAVATDLTKAAHNWPPQQPTPAYTPVHPKAANGLPPGVKPGEGVRFTFKVYDLDTTLRYYSVDTDGWLVGQALTPNYADWYSAVQDGRLAVSQLQRAAFYPDQAWSFGMLLWRDGNLASGDILRAAYQNHGLFVYHIDNALYLTYRTANGVTYAWQGTLSGGYQYLYAQMSYGTLVVGLDGDEYTLVPTTTAAGTLSDGTWLGGGGVYVDDLVLVNSDVVSMPLIRDWLFGGA